MYPNDAPGCVILSVKGIFCSSAGMHKSHSVEIGSSSAVPFNVHIFIIVLQVSPEYILLTCEHCKYAFIDAQSSKRLPVTEDLRLTSGAPALVFCSGMRMFHVI